MQIPIDLNSPNSLPVCVLVELFQAQSTSMDGGVAAQLPYLLLV